MRTIGGIACVCMAVLVFTSGCMTYPHPLSTGQGWKRLTAEDYEKFEPAIRADYQSYIQRLSEKERWQITRSSIHFFRNTNGQRAISFDIGRPGIVGEVIYAHVLIYDANNKRIKVTKRKTDRAVII